MSGRASRSTTRRDTPAGARPEGEVWDLMRALVLDLHGGRQEAMETLGMSWGRVKTLRRIAKLGPMPLRDLVVVLGGDAPRTSVLVDDLVERGLVERTPHPQDRRAKMVAVTDAGRALAQRANAQLDRPPAGLAALTDEELQSLRDLLDRVAGGAVVAVGAGGARG